jgi:Zn-dependent protease with chaperone function
MAMAAALIALGTISAAAQVSSDSLRPDSILPPNAMVQHECVASQVSSGPEFDEVRTIVQRLAVANPNIKIAVTRGPMVDAQEAEVSADTSLICVPVVLVHVMENEGELAFIVGHEFGHALDEQCKSLAGRAQVADRSASGKSLTILFGHGSGDGARNQRACESRADEIGLNLMTRAGYDPHDAPAALELLGKYGGGRGSGPMARIAAVGDDHPILADRVRHLRKLIANQAKTP